VATVRSIVLACLNWADREGLVDGHPLRKLKAGRYDRRERILTTAEKDAIRAAVPPYLLDFLDALALTGARPYSEVARLTAAMIDWGAGVIPLARHKNANKGKPRTVYLTPPLEALLRRKAAEHPTGLLFRTRRGVQWTAPHMHYWLRKLERTLGLPRITLYAWRHTMVTEALERGLTGDLVAELVGNSPQTIAKYYSKLSEKRATLKAAAAQAVG
jgi:integrase